jgi:hypothetical protein
MDINTAGALSALNNQTMLQAAQASGASQSGAQSAAVIQALTSAYSNAIGSTSSDPLADVAGAGGLAALVSGIYSASAASGGIANPITTLSTSLTAAVGGTNASTASGILAGLGTDGLQGIPAQALDMNADLALTAYTDTQNGLPSGTFTAAASALASSIDPASASSVQSAVQAAASSTNTNLLNLLA